MGRDIVPSRAMNLSTPRARDIARELLKGSGDRWTHVQSVGRTADDLAAQGLDIPEDVISAAWLHDIGYATPLADTGFHPIDGARWLAAQGAPMQIVALVAYHSGARFEAEECDLTDELAVFPQPDEELLDLLTMLDMTVGPTGSGVTVGTRLEEILSRYPSEHPVHQAVARSHDYLMASANRAAARLHGSGVRALSPASPWTVRDLGRDG